MSSFDPTAVRKAVAEFTPRRPEKFQDLLPAKDVITELRQKRASYPQLEAEKARLLDPLDTAKNEREQALKKDLAAINKDLATT